MKIPADMPGLVPSGIGLLKGRNDREALKAVAKEMEAMFAYELLKAMRATAGGDGSFGGDTYMSLFDLELAKVLAERGLGLQEMLLRGLGSTTAPDGGAPESNEKQVGTPYVRERSMPNPSIPSKKGDPIAPGTNEPGAKVESGQELSDLPVEGILSSPFGSRIHPIHGDRRFHNGIDIAAPEGTGIYPLRSGRVIFSGEQPGYGNVVIIDHGDGYMTKYAHNKVNLVKEGEVVDRDRVIAQVGSTGSSTGPHLHFEVKHNGGHIDPLTVVARR